MSSTTRPIIINPRTCLQPVPVMESYPNFRSHYPPFSLPCLWFAVLGNGISLNKVAVHIYSVNGMDLMLSDGVISTLSTY